MRPAVHYAKGGRVCCGYKHRPHEAEVVFQIRRTSVFLCVPCIALMELDRITGEKWTKHRIPWRR